MAKTASSHNIVPNRRARRSAILLGSAAICALLPTSAFAQCVPTGPNDYVCQNPTTTPQVIAGPVSKVTTNPGFSVNSSTGTALSVTATSGEASYVDANASNVTSNAAAINITATNGNLTIQTGGNLAAGLNAVNATETGTGTITLDFSGSVSSVTGEGIVVRNTTAGGNIRVTTAAVSAPTLGRDAIDVQSFSTTANVEVIAGGNLQAGRVGVLVGILRPDSTGNVDVITNGAIDAGIGIDVANFGTGTTDVTANGPVNATAFHGLSAVASGGNVTVQAGDVTSTLATGIIARQTDATGAGIIDVTADNVSGTTGVELTNSGSGAINYTDTGTVTGTTGSGIAITGNGAVSVSVADLVTGSTSGLQLVGGNGDISVTGAGGFTGGTGDAANILHNGIGSVTVNISGASSSTSGNGIFVRNNASGGDVSLTSGSISASNTGSNAVDIQSVSTTADVTVVTNGALQAGGTGVIADILSSVATGDLNVTANGAVNAGTGILASNRGAGSTTVNVTGPVTATSGNGITASTTGLNVSVTAGPGTISGASGIDATNTGDGATSVTATGNVIGTTADGIFISGSASTTDTTVNAVNSTGVRSGITVSTLGSGATRVNSTGTATGTDSAGIFVSSRANAGGLIVNSNVATGRTGVFVSSSGGTGSVSVSTTGNSSGTTDDGVSVRTAATNQDLTIVNSGTATGVTFGILADSFGTGNTNVTSTGDAVATAGTGLRVNASATTVNMSVNAVNTTGTVAGIDVRASGTGNVVVNSTGTATGGTFAGISFSGLAGPDNVTVNANNASGAVGVQVLAQGSGATVVNVTGNTSGTVNDGIFAGNFGASTTDLTVINSGIATGARFGIVAQNFGSGFVSVTSTGDAIGGGAVAQAGIRAISGPTANGISINATNAAGFRGIHAENRGLGTTSITATGNVTGIAEGIFAEAFATAGDIAITANNVNGGTVGIGIDNAGTGDAAVTISGIVQGGTAAISSLSTDAQGLRVINNGTLRNASGLSSDSVVLVNGGPLLLNNNGALLGTLTLVGALADEEEEDVGDVGTTGTRTLGFTTLAAGEDDVVNNFGTWNSIGGTSDFGVGDDNLNNRTTGRIIAALAAGAAETTTYADLEIFSNQGVIALNDGGTGDRLVTDGALFMQSGSLLAIDVGAGNASDIVTVGGAATIQAGANLAINPLTPGAIGDVHTFLTATNGVTGTFTLVNNFVTAFKGYRLGYTANSAFVEFAQVQALASAAVTPNQISAANGLDGLAANNPVKTALLNLTSDAQAQVAFDLLSGEIHPTLRTVMTEDSRLPRNAVLERLGANRSAAIWGQTFGNWAKSDGNRNAAAADRDSYGVLAGADFGGGEEGGLIAGAMLGYIDTDILVSDRASKASVNTLNGMLYAGIRSGGFSVKGGVGYARANIDTKRTIAIPAFTALLTDSYKGSVAQAFGEVGYRVALGGGYAEPYAALTAMRAHSNAVAETGGAAAINAASTNEKSMMTTGGFRFGTGLSGALSVNGNIGWQHAFGGLSPVNINTLVGSSPFRIEGAAQSRDAGVMSIAARYAVTANTEFELGYDGVIGTAAQDHAAKATLRIRF